MHRFSLTLVSLSLALPAAFAQPSSSSLISPSFLSNDSAAGSGAGATRSAAASQSRAFPGIGVGAKVGLLGPGFEVAVPVARRFNVRAGGNFFSYTDSLTSNGIAYSANLRFRSVETSLDWFPWGGGFHISPGALIYNGNQVTGGANVPGGQTFTLNDQDYTSSVSDPVTGSGSLTFAKAAPKITVGWGNLVPRGERHFSFPFEAGFAYVGYPKFQLHLQGTACYMDQGTPYCDSVATDSNIQSNLATQVQKINNDAAPARFYPILSQGFAVRF